MKVWLIQANEPIPAVDKNQRPFRTGMLAEALLKQGHEVVWFAATFDHYTKTQRFSVNQMVQIEDNFQIQFLYGCRYQKNISLLRIKNHIQIAKQFKRVSRKLQEPDLIYCSFPPIYLAKKALSYANQKNIKFVLDVRDLWPEVFERAVPKKMYWVTNPIFRYLHRLVNQLYRNSYAVNAVSNECVNYVIEKSGRKKKKYDSGYFIGFPNRYQLSAEESLIARAEKVQIIFVGTLSNQINYDLICKIAMKLKNIDFIIGGDGPLSEDFHTLAKDLPNIQFKGWLDANTIQQYMKQASFALIPYYDTFDFQLGVGNKFAEALCYALPPIVLCNGVMKNLILNNQCGVFGKDAHDVAYQITELLDDDIKYQNYVKNAHHLYQEQFDSSKIYPNLVNDLVKLQEE